MKIDNLNKYAKLHICNELLSDIQNITDDKLEKLVYILKSLNICERFNKSESDKLRIKMFEMYENELNELNDADLDISKFIQLINTDLSNIVINDLTI